MNIADALRQTVKDHTDTHGNIDYEKLAKSVMPVSRINRPPKFIEFQEVVNVNRKTKVFLVYNKENFETPIGEIKWYGAWRKYSFFPQPNTVYENTCMQDIINFINQLMDEWKAARES
jgi:hypothetical protein